jgi:hypothetical protein
MLNPTAQTFQKKKDEISSNNEFAMKIKIENETKEATSSSGSGQFTAPAFSLFADEAPKKTKPKGGFVEMKENKLKGGLSDGKTLEDIAKKHKVSLSSVMNQFIMGIKIEKEHTEDTNIAEEIAMDHLYEDPNYYTNLKRIEKGEFKEATGAASAGQYSGPSFLAKSQNKKDWRGAAKPLYKGGKFVRVKKKCKTFPYCNQGDIKALELWEDDKLTEAIKNVSKSKKIHENVIRAIILNEIEKKLFDN